MTVLLLAPHLRYPLRMGMDLYAEGLGRHLSASRGEVVILGENSLTTYQQGEMQRQEFYSNRMRRKPSAALRTLFFGSHYYLEKFLTPAYRARAAQLISQHPAALVICSYIVSASLLQNRTAHPTTVVLTHNDEIAWFRQQRGSRNPIQKLTALRSARWVRRFLQRHAGEYIFAHISPQDAAGYREVIPGQRALILPAGVDLDLQPQTPAAVSDGRLRLLFCGALSVKINQDALLFFRQQYWPLIKGGLGEQVEITVAGSQPGRTITKLCAEEGWKLRADLPDDELQACYRQSMFSILPFPYTTGAKLKLLHSLAAGLPVMATANMKSMPDQDFLPNLYADDPQAWLKHLESYSRAGLPPETPAICQSFASRYRWQTIVEQFDRDLTELCLEAEEQMTMARRADQ